MLTKTDLGYAESFASVEEFISVDASTERAGSDREWMFGAAGNESKTRSMLLSGECMPAALEAAAASKDRALSALASTMGATKRRRAVWSDSGDDWDADRVNVNHEYSARDVRVGRQAPIVRLGVNFNLSWSNSEESFARAIGAAAGVADCLTVAGYSVEIVGMQAFVGHNSAAKEYKMEPCVYRFPIKGSDESLDIARVCSLALTGLLRYWGAARALSDTKASNWSAQVHVAHKSLGGVDAMVSQSWYGNEQRYVEDLLGGLNEPAPEPEPEPEYAPAPTPEPAPRPDEEEPEEPNHAPEPEREPSPNDGPRVKRGTGPRGDGIEISFPNKPAPNVLARLKGLGFRWSPRSKVWYAKDSAAKYAAAVSMF